jgi:hypothetical protein
MVVPTDCNVLDPNEWVSVAGSGGGFSCVADWTLAGTGGGLSVCVVVIQTSATPGQTLFDRGGRRICLIYPA